MKKLKDDTLQYFIDKVFSSMPALFTQLPIEKQEVLIKLIKDRINKNQLDAKIGVIDSNILQKEFKEISLNSKKLFGERFDEGSEFFLAEDVWNGLFASSIDNSVSELVKKRFAIMKTTKSVDEYFDRGKYDYSRALLRAEQSVGESKLSHATIISNAQVIKNIELHKVVNGKFGVEGNHDGNMTAKTMMTTKKKLNTYDYGIWRPLQDTQDYNSYPSCFTFDKKKYEELLEL